MADTDFAQNKCPTMTLPRNFNHSDTNVLRLAQIICHNLQSPENRLIHPQNSTIFPFISRRRHFSLSS